MRDAQKLTIFAWKQYDKRAKKKIKVNQLGKYLHASNQSVCSVLV